MSKMMVNTKVDTMDTKKCKQQDISYSTINILNNIKNISNNTITPRIDTMMMRTSKSTLNTINITTNTTNTINTINTINSSNTLNSSRNRWKSSRNRFPRNEGVFYADGINSQETFRLLISYRKEKLCCSCIPSRVRSPTIC